MQERWLLYLDLLGTKDIFNEGSTNDSDSKLYAFEQIVDHISQNNCQQSIHDIENQRYVRPEYTSFSDHLAISYPVDYDIIDDKKTNPIIIIISQKLLVH